MMKYFYFLVEGQQDISFLRKILKILYDFESVKKINDLDEFWHPLVPTKYPHQGDLQRRVPVPLFLRNSKSEYSVAIHGDTGINGITDTLEESLSVISPSSLSGIGILLDADSEETPVERRKKLLGHLKSKPAVCTFLSSSKSLEKGKLVIFIAPDDQSKGTLESVLLKLAKFNYSHLLELAHRYYESVDRSQLSQKDLKEVNKPAGKEKALVSLVSSFLKPGKSLSVTLQDNEWISQKSLKLDEMKKIKEFIDKVLGQ